MSTPEMPETDVAELIRNVNATNNAVEDQCLRTRQAADAAIRSDRAAEEAKAAALAAGNLRLVSASPSVLVVITDPESAIVMRATGALVEGTVRTGERVIILSARGGAPLASGKAPGSPATSVPNPPVAPRHPTTFQRARYNQAVRKYRTTVARDRAALLSRQRGRLAAWAASLVARAASRPTLQSTQGTDVGADLGAASSAIASMRQAGLPYRTPAVIAVMAVSRAAAPMPAAGLQASTVVVDDFPGSTAEQAAWQSSLVQDGAARAVVLTPATDDQLVSVVRQGLDGAIIDTLTSVLFAGGNTRCGPPRCRSCGTCCTCSRSRTRTPPPQSTDTPITCPCRARAAISCCPNGARRQYCSGSSRTRSQPPGFRPSATATPTRRHPIPPAASRSTGAWSSSSTRR